MPYLALFLVVLGINLLPAFGPPTWAVLVFTRIHWHLNPVVLVVIGGLGAMLGRYLLACGARQFRGRLKPQRRDNLTAVSNALLKRRSTAMASLALFAISPLPSAQLFVAAGLLELDLIPLTLAFFVGRLVSYSIYITVATVAEHQLGSVLGHLLGSPWSIALQVVLLAAVAVLPFIDWKSLLERRSKDGGGTSLPS